MTGNYRIKMNSNARLNGHHAKVRLNKFYLIRIIRDKSKGPIIKDNLIKNHNLTMMKIQDNY